MENTRELSERLLLHSLIPSVQSLTKAKTTAAPLSCQCALGTECSLLNDGSQYEKGGTSKLISQMYLPVRGRGVGAQAGGAHGKERSSLSFTVLKTL